MPPTEFDDVPPAAGPMLEAMRAYGYSLQTAIADLIDNSISAGANCVWIQFHWDGPASFISIRDNGRGMSEAELIKGLQPGFRNPKEKRPPHDLGRFGLGLKTASLSQCKRLTVASKPLGGSVSIRRWDLDYIATVNQWHLLKSPAPDSAPRLSQLLEMPQGTIVLWEVMDRVVGDDVFGGPRGHDRFFKLIDIVEQHIGMVFHRFLKTPRPALRIFINGDGDENSVVAWDPFLEEHPSTIPTPTEPIPCGDGTVLVTGFVLPHKDKLTAAEQAAAAGPEDWVGQQGFYIYRNERMLVSGSWLGMWSKEEQFRLARIRVDIPNSMDMDWQIDVKKSRARPPALVMARLRHLGAAVRKQSRRVFSFRGNYGARNTHEEVIRLWKHIVQNGRRSYRIDRQHVFIKPLLDASEAAEPALRILEETLPIQQIWLDTAEQSESAAHPFEQAPPEDVRYLLRRSFQALVKVDGLSSAEAKLRLKRMDAFLQFPDMIDQIDSPEGANGD